MGETCEWVAYLSTTCVIISTGGGGGGGGGNEEECNPETGSCGGGGGGGNNGDGDNDDEEELEITLFCPETVEWGRVAKCEVVFENLEELTFAWSSDWIRGHTGSSWSGTVTDDVTISVSATDSTTGWNDTAKISVTDRKWGVPPRLNPRLEYMELDSGQGGEFRLITRAPQLGAGTGPWNGRYYVRKAPTISGELYISTNYSSGGPWPRYPFNYRNLPPAARAACPEVEFIGGSISYWSLNSKCGSLDGWDVMRKQILRHEREHRDGYNSYLQNPATSTFFSDLEELTGSRSDVAPELTNDSGMWKEYRKKLNAAGVNAAKPTTSIYPFFYHLGNWVYDVRTGGRH